MSSRVQRRWTHHAYVDPDAPERIAFWHRRMENADGSPLADGRTKNITYVRPCSPDSTDTRLGLDGKPPRALADRCLYGLPELRRGLSTGVPAVFWCEGEKDCRAGRMLLEDAGLTFDAVGKSWTATEGVAVSHHGGAGQATPEQAEHFRGYPGRVYVAVDWDAAGAACALRRRELLRALGVRVRLVRPANAALRFPALPPDARGEGGGLSAPDRFELDAEARRLGLTECPDGGADLTDHVDAGYALRDLVRVRPADLRAAARQAQARWARGASVDGYGLWAAGRGDYAESVWARETSDVQPKDPAMNSRETARPTPPKRSVDRGHSTTSTPRSGRIGQLSGTRI